MAASAFDGAVMDAAGPVAELKPRSLTRARVVKDIEALRGVSILLVLIAHLDLLLPWPDEVFSLTSKANFGIGVDLFFAISGYVITRSLCGEFERGGAQSARVSLARFWIRRVFRLLPAAILTIVTTLAVVAAFETTAPFDRLGGTDQTARAAVAALADVFNGWGFLQISAGRPLTYLAHFWSLSLEEQFYLVWPVLLFAGLAHKGRLIAAALAIIAAFAFLDRSDFRHFWWWFRIDAISWGVLVYLVRERFGLRPAFGKTPLAVGLIALTFALISFQNVFGHGPLATSGGAACAGLMVFLAAADADALQSRTFASVWLNYLGARSYTIYLWHLLIFAVVQAVWRSIVVLPPSISWPLATLILLSLLPALLIVEISYRVVETPTRRLGARLASRLR